MFFDSEVRIGHAARLGELRNRNTSCVPQNDANFGIAARVPSAGSHAEHRIDLFGRAAEWTVASYIGPGRAAHRQEVRTFDGKDPIAFYLEDVMLHGTPEAVADQIRALETDAGMTYLMAAPLSRRSFTMLTDKVLPRIAG